MKPDEAHPLDQPRAGPGLVNIGTPDTDGLSKGIVLRDRSTSSAYPHLHGVPGEREGVWFARGVGGRLIVVGLHLPQHGRCHRGVQLKQRVSCDSVM